MSVVLEILLILLLIAANGVFALTEIAIVSSRKSRLQAEAEKGNARAKIALDLANNPNHLLSTVQIGITLIGILAGAIGGATLTQQSAELLRQIPSISNYAEEFSFIFIVCCITYVTLIAGELVPKSLALNQPEKFAITMARPMYVLSKIASPVVRFLSSSIDFVLKVLRIERNFQPSVSDEEIRMLIAQGTQIGVFEKVEKDLVDRVLRLADRRVGSTMTPRSQMVCIDLTDPEEFNREKILQSTHTRFPVCKGSLSNLLGIVQAKDLLVRRISGDEKELSSVLLSPLFVPESQRALKLLELFKETGTHMAFVVDEYGGIEGLVTLHDVMEAITGAIREVDQEEKPVVQREDGSLLFDGMLDKEELKSLLNLTYLPNEESFNTVGGLMITHLARIPSTGDHFDLDGFRFEVVDMDGKRVDKVLVTRTAPL